MPEPVAIARGIAKRFRGPPAVEALKGVGIAVRPGAITGLVGPDGAGKTTLIRILAGLMIPDAGETLILGVPPARALEHIGYMPQRFGLYEDLTVRENLDLYANLRALPKAERPKVYDRLFGFTDLGPFQDRPAGKLSGGMKQKLGLACALVTTPKLLLLDEPGVGVDPISRRELWAMVGELKAEGIAVLWSTAYLDEAERCDEVYLLSQGELVFDGKPDALTERVEGRVIVVSGFEQRRRKFLAQTLDRDDVIDGTIHGRAVRLLIGGGKPIPRSDDLAGGRNLKVARTEPHFEDAFIELLGGGPSGTSKLAARYRTIPESDRPAIEAKHLSKRFGSFIAAQDMNFSIPRGQIFGLLGPNGAGKSTTFKMLCGLLSPTEGTGAVAGNDLRRAAAEARASLGYMAQKFSLYGDLSVAQNLDFFARAYNLGRSDAREAIAEMTEVFELAPMLDVNAGNLPLGFKQRLALACAVMHQPPVLFLDEPTSGVDPVMRREFWTHINGLVERGVTVLVTTHFMEEAEYCDAVSLIYRARQIASGSPDELKAQCIKLVGEESFGAEGPTMEAAFIALVEASDKEARKAA